MRQIRVFQSVTQPQLAHHEVVKTTNTRPLIVTDWRLLSPRNTWPSSTIIHLKHRGRPPNAWPSSTTTTRGGVPLDP